MKRFQGVSNAPVAIAFGPTHYSRSRMWKPNGTGTDVARRTLTSPDKLSVNINEVGYAITSAINFDLNSNSSWDTLTPTNYTTAANRAGKDFYVYACQPLSGITPTFKISAASTYPYGYTATTSRKIASFHCLCVDVGTISGHPLSGYLAGDILPRSIQDLLHRPRGRFLPGFVWSGLVDYDSYTGPSIWTMIYLQSGTGSSSASVYGGTITDSRTWLDFVDDLAAIGCRMLDDSEFQAVAALSNEETNIAGSADPVTTGGHVDTAGRRMISWCGCEDMCGVMFQWLSDQGYRFNGATNHTHDVVVSGDPETATTGDPSVDVAPSWSYYDLPGSKGSLYGQGTYCSDVKLRAGGPWANGSYAGSRCRYVYGYRWFASSNVGGRGCAEP